MTAHRTAPTHTPHRTRQPADTHTAHVHGSPRTGGTLDGGPRAAVAETASTPVLYTPSHAAELLAVRESWLRRKAARRAIPCTFLGKHLRFSTADLRGILEAGAQRTRRSPAGRR